MDDRVCKTASHFKGQAPALDPAGDSLKHCLPRDSKKPHSISSAVPLSTPSQLPFAFACTTSSPSTPSAQCAVPRPSPLLQLLHAASVGISACARALSSDHAAYYTPGPPSSLNPSLHSPPPDWVPHRHVCMHRGHLKPNRTNLNLLCPSLQPQCSSPSYANATWNGSLG